MDRKNTVCTMPWNGIHVTDRDINICCNTNVPLLDDEGNRVNINNLSDIKSGSYIKKIKNDMLSGVQNPHCDRCWQMEPHSFRQRVYNQNFKDTYNIICSDTPENMPLEHMSISIGNVCNLNCRMCDPSSSSMIAKEWERGGHPLGKEIIAKSDRNNSYLGDPVFLDYVRNNCTHLKEIFIFGGEPFIIIEEHLKFLQLLVDLNVAKNIKISYSTNATNVNMRRFVDLFKEFRQVIFSISTDGMGRHYDFIRWPNTWEKHSKNLSYYKKMLDDNHNFFGSVACTIQATNIEHLKDYHKWATDYGFETFYLPVNYPEEMSLAAVPLDILKRVYNEHICGQIDAIIKPFIDSHNQETSKELFQKFLTVTKWQDEYRNQNVFDFYPQMENWHV